MATIEIYFDRSAATGLYGDTARDMPYSASIRGDTDRLAVGLGADEHEALNALANQKQVSIQALLEGAESIRTG